MVGFQSRECFVKRDRWPFAFVRRLLGVAESFKKTEQRELHQLCVLLGPLRVPLAITVCSRHNHKVSTTFALGANILMGVFGEEGIGVGDGVLRLWTGRSPPLRHGDMRVLVLVLVLVIVLLLVTVGGSINKLKFVFTFTGRRRGRQGSGHGLLARTRRAGAGAVLRLLCAAASGPPVAVLRGDLRRRLGLLTEGAGHGSSLGPWAAAGLVAAGQGLSLEPLLHLLYAGLEGLELCGLGLDGVFPIAIATVSDLWGHSSYIAVSEWVGGLDWLAWAGTGAGAR